MKYVFSDWDKFEESLKDKFIYLFLDYDGTLAPIAKTPDMALMPEKTKRLLQRLSKMPNFKLAIISGRALSDVKKMAGLKNNVVYAGNHGFEIKGPKVKFKSPVPAGYNRKLRDIKIGLKKGLSSVKGVLIQDKGPSLALHYRLVAGKQLSGVKRIFQKTVLADSIRNTIEIKAGKKVFEIRPPVKWNKGEAVLWLLARQKAADRNKDILPVYIGDDVTDEDAFNALKDKGITVFVGRRGRTKAQFYLKDTKEVTKLLEAILNR